MIIFFLISSAFSHTLNNAVDTKPLNQVILQNLYKLDAKLDQEFKQFKDIVKQNDLFLLRKEMVTDLEGQLRSKEIQNFKDLERIWIQISVDRIRKMTEFKSLVRRNSANRKPNLMKFVKVAGVVGLTVTYMVTVSILSLAVLAGLAHTFVSNKKVI
jgi:hypothetical protein